MADELRMGAMLILLLNLGISLVFTFNVAVDDRYDLHKPDSKYFGYSISFHKKTSLVVGAPLDDSNGGEKGAVYMCSLIDKTCEISSYVDTRDIGDEIKKNQMMGATVYSDNTNILGCAPRFKKVGNPINGIKEKRLYGVCYIFTKEEQKAIWSPCEEVYNDRRSLIEFRFCQAGFSAKLFKGSSKSILGGIPNIQLNRGRIGLGNIRDPSISLTRGSKIDFNGYMGFSATSGYFGNDKHIHFAGGSPRSNALKGRVIMYKDSAGYEISQYLDDPSDQIGTYFGSAMASADINGDGLADLVVGAPYYTGTVSNEGIAYVYLNKNGIVELVQTLRQPEGKDVKENGMFGISIGSVGDLNNDGFADIAIGAPWGGEDGKGIVFVYYGQRDPAQLKLMQTIKPSDLSGIDVDGFGYSFAEFYPYSGGPDQYGFIENDPDYNIYPDLAVGAFKSNHAIVFKSRPVYTIVGRLSLGGVKRLDLVNKENLCPNGMKCLDKVQACLMFKEEESEGEVDYTLEVDSGRDSPKRAYLLDSDGKQVTKINKQTTVSKDEECDDYTIYVKNTTDVLSDLVIKLSWKFVVPTTCDGVCPVANELFQFVDTKSIIFVKGCSDDGDDTCSSDLHLEIEKKEFTPKLVGTEEIISAGATDGIILTFNIKNLGENAFDNSLKLEYPGKGDMKLVNIDDAKVISDYYGTPIWDSDVTREKDVTTLSVMLSSPIVKGKPEQVQVKMSLNPIPKGTKFLKFKAYLETDSEETDTSNDFQEITIPVELVSNLLVSGQSIPEILTWRKDVKDVQDKGAEITYNFLFQNQGPSNVDTSEAIILIPEKFKGSYFLNIYNYDVKGSKSGSDPGSCRIEGELNPLKLDYYGRRIGNNTRKRRDTRGVPALECGADTTCREIICNFNIENRNSATVTVKATLVDANFDSVIGAGREIHVTAEFSSDAVTPPSGLEFPVKSMVTTTVNSPYLTKTEGGESIPWWIILLCILAAIIIIGVIIFIMYKKGFFKRKKMADEDEALRNGDPEMDDD